MVFMIMQGCKNRNLQKETQYQYYNLSFKENVESFDPVSSVDETSGIILNLLHRNLFTTDLKGNFIKDLANQEIVYGTKVFISIKPGVLFNNDHRNELTAVDVVFSLQRLKNSGRQPWILDKVEKIEIYNRYTVIFTLKSAGQNAWKRQTYLLSLPQCAIYSKKDFEESNKIIGASSFLITKVDSTHIELSSTSGVQLNYQIIPAESGRWFYYQRGKLDLYESEGIYRYMTNEKKGFKKISLSQPIVFYAAIVADEKSVLNNRQLRIALNYRLDRKSLTENILLGSYQSADYPVPDILGGKVPVLYKYDKDYPCPGKSRLNSEPVIIYSLSDRDRQLTARVIQGLLSGCGVTSRIKITDLSTMLSLNNQGKNGIYLLKWVADYPHAENFIIPLFYGKNKGMGGNRSYFKNTQLDQILETEGVTEENLEHVQEIIRQDAPWIFIGFAQKSYYVNEKKNINIPPIYTGWNEQAFGLKD